MSKAPIFSEQFKEEVFFMWARRCGRNSRKTYRYLKKRGTYTHVPSAKTIARWAEDEDWEVNAKYMAREFRGIVKELDKGILSFIGQDAVEAVFLDWLMTNKIVKAFRRKGIKALEPKNVNEAVSLYKFATARADVLLERADMGRERAQQPPPEQQRVLDLVRRESISEGMEQSRALYRTLQTQGITMSPDNKHAFEGEVIVPKPLSLSAQRRAVVKKRRLK